MKSDFKKIFSSYKIIDFLYLAMLLATVLILIDASDIPSDTGTSLSHSSMSPYNTGWDIINSDGTYSSVTLPVYNNAKAEGPVAVTRILDKTECDDVNHIFIFTVHSVLSSFNIVAICFIYNKGIFQMFNVLSNGISTNV